MVSVSENDGETSIGVETERGTYRFLIASEAFAGAVSCKDLQGLMVEVSIDDDGLIRFTAEDRSECVAGTLPEVEAWQVEGPDGFLAIAVPGGGWDYFDETSHPGRPPGHLDFPPDEATGRL